MKKLLYLALILAIALPAFTSCTKNNDEYKAGTIYHLSLSQDLFDLCDIVVTYRDSDSTIKSDKITDIEWKKMVMHQSYDFNVLLGYELKLKPDVKLTENAYHISVFYEIINNFDYTGRRGEGNTGALDTIMERSVQPDQIESTIAALNSKGNPIISINHQTAQCHVVEGDFEDVDKFFMTYHGYSPSANSDSLMKVAEENTNNLDGTTAK